jgi:hypothetical protein
VAKRKRKKTRRPSRPPARTPVAAAGGGSAATSTEDEEAVESLDGEAKAATAGRKRAATATPVSNRQARKELARKERERRIKAARRRARNRRLIRWGIVLAVVGGIAATVWYQVTAGRRLEEEATRVAAAFDASDPEPPLPDAGAGHTPPYPYENDDDGLPAASGPHNPTPLPAEPKVYDRAVPEASAVHNLEHGYVLVYYQPEGEGALPDAVREELADLVEGQDQVIMAPYPKLGEGQNLALVAWRHLQIASVPAGETAPEDAATLARYFIETYRDGSLAPEAAAP